MGPFHLTLTTFRGLPTFAFGLALLGCAPLSPGSEEAEGKKAADTANQRRQPKETPPPPAPITIGLSAMSLSPDGKLLVTGYAVKDGKEGDREEGHLAKVWDVASGKRLHVLKEHDGNISFAAFLPDSKRVVTAGGKTLKMWDARTGKLLWSSEAHGWRITSAALSPDGKFVLSCGYEDGKTVGSARTLNLCDTATGKLLREFKQYNNRSIGRITFSPDSRHAFLGWDPRLLDITTGETARYFKEGETWKYPRAFSPDGKLALSEKQDELGRPFHLVLWELASGKVVRHFDSRSDTNELGTSLASQTLVFTPDGKRVLSGDWDGKIRTWDVATGKRISSVSLFDDDPTGMNAMRKGPPEKAVVRLFLPDGKWAITSSGSKKAGAGYSSIMFTLWDMAEGKLLRRFAFEPGYKGYTP